MQLAVCRYKTVKRRILEVVERLEGKVESLMATAEQIKAALDQANSALDRANTAATDIAADVRGLHDQIAKLDPSSISQADLDSLTQKSDDLAKRLEAVAAETPPVTPEGGGGDGEPPAEGDPPAEGAPA